MKSNKFIFLALLTLISYSSFSQTWPIREVDDPNNWNSISATFGEIHPTHQDHFHGAIDIDVSTANCPFYPVDNGRVMNIGGISVAARHPWPEGANSFNRRTRYLHVNAINNLANGDNILTTTQLGTIDNNNAGAGDHLHLELWEHIDGNWFRLNPFNNEVNWSLAVPVDNGDPQVNDVILEPINQPNGINSGYNILNTNGSIVTYANDAMVKVHLENAGNENDPVFDENADNLIVYGSLGPIVRTRDQTINHNAGDGAGLTVRRIEYSLVAHQEQGQPALAPQQKYLIVFDKIEATWQNAGDDFRDYNSIFHVPFNTNPPTNNNIYDDPECNLGGCSNRYFGNEDFIELRHLENQTNADENDNFLDFHQEINNIQSNGIWFSKARTGTAQIFQNTPTQIARDNSEALYEDRKYDMIFRAEDESGADSQEDFIVIVDNFKPYVKRVKMEIAGTSIYERVWNFNAGCGGIQNATITSSFNDYTLDQLETNGVTITVELSESMQSLELNIPLFNMPTVNNPTISNNRKQFVYNTGPINNFNTTNTDLSLRFTGQDFATNTLLNLTDFTNNTCLAMPLRNGNNGWDDPNNIPQGTDVTHEIPCPVITNNSLIHPSATNNEGHPSDCGVADGSIRVISTSATGGFAPYTYELQDENGTTLTSNNNLAAGTYQHVVTDVMGCTEVKIIELIPLTSPVLADPIIDGSCAQQANGSITVLVSNSTDPSALFNCVWSNGVENMETTIAEIENILPGTYTVTVTSTNGGNCEVIEEFIVPTLNATSSLAFNPLIIHSCPQSGTGTIQTNVSGGIPINTSSSPYDYSWSDNNTLNTANRTNLSAGTYTVTVTDYCGDTETESFIITSLSVGFPEVISGCSGEGTISFGNVSGGTQPYTYKWSNGETTSTIQELNSGTYTVTISDAKGCNLVIPIFMQNKEYDVEIIEPCEGFNDGIISITVLTGAVSNIPYTVEFNGLPLQSSANNEFEIPELSANIPYSLDIVVGGCTYNEEITLEGAPLDKVFTDYTNDNGIELCNYDDYCKGELIEENSYSQSPLYDVDNAAGGWLTKCEMPLYCNNDGTPILVDNKGYNKRNVKALVYFRILLNAQVASTHNPDYIQSLIDYYNSKELSFCAKIRYCPANLKIIGIWNKFINATNYVDLGNDCWSINCQYFFGWNDIEFCTSEEVPDYFSNTYLYGGQQFCNPRRYNLYQLILWKEALIVDFPNLFEGSELFNLIEAYENNNVALCSEVTFCLTDFSVLNHNAAEQTCPNASYWIVNPNTLVAEEFSTPTCIAEVTDPDGNVSVGVCSNNGVAQFVYFEPNYPGNLNFTSTPNVDEYTTVIIPHDNACTEFNNFGETHSEGVITPKGLFSKGNGYGFNDFTHTNKEMNLSDMPSVQHYIEDMDNEQIAYIEKSIANSNFLKYEGNSQSWSLELNSDKIDISLLTKVNDVLYVGGEFSGKLLLNGGTVANSQNANSAFLYQFSLVGEPNDLLIISDVSSNDKTVFTENNGSIFISGRAISNQVTIGGVSYNLSNSQGVFKAKINNDFSVAMQTNISYTSNVKLLRELEGGDNSPSTKILRGSGTISIEDSNYSLDGQNKLFLLSTNPDKSFKYAKSFDLLGIDANELDGVYDEAGNLYVGITFSNTISIEGQSFSSLGGDDILLLKFDDSGELVSHLKYGTPSDENVNQLLYNDGLIYIGGDFSGLDSVRVIGKRIFNNQSSCDQSAFISYVLVDDFIEEGNEGLISENSHNEVSRIEDKNQVENVNNNDVKIYPNPFDEHLYITFNSPINQNYQIRIFNLLGKTIHKENIFVTNGNKNVEIQELSTKPAGVYIVEVMSEDGNLVKAMQVVKE